MEILTPEDFLLRKALFLKAIREGAVFIYPTDTIYGIGCDARNKGAVARIRAMKQRSERPFSVIAPSRKWILENCAVPEGAQEWLDKLPGPYTFVLKLANAQAVAQEVTPGADTLGVRIPKHWFAAIAAELNIPIVSTSANVTRQKHMTSLQDVDKDIIGKVDFIVYEGEKSTNPSTLVRLTGEVTEVVER
jgi:L-threonylcarbamoyladenylate synthase